MKDVNYLKELRKEISDSTGNRYFKEKQKASFCRLKGYLLQNSARQYEPIGFRNSDNY